MGCGSGGCSSGGCGLKGALTGSVAGGGGGQAGGSGGCGSEPWDGTYREVAGLKLGPYARTTYFDSTGFLLSMAEACVVESESGEDYGVVVQPTGPSRKFAGVKSLRRILRVATAEDREAERRNESIRREALGYTREKARDLKLEMKVAEVDPSFDGRRLLCYFTAEERVDFRELVRDLAQRFKRRIEMRQIGARDEAKILGGYGICGRPLCCSTFLTEFAPISVKMAKRQGLSLNPSKISGLCGRLMCCLRYEDTDVPKASPAPRPAGPEAAPPPPPSGDQSPGSSGSPGPGEPGPSTAL